MPNPSSRSPWKVLIVGLLVCTFFFVVAVGLAVQWLFSLTQGTTRSERTVERRRDQLVRSLPFAGPSEGGPARFSTNVLDGLSTNRDSTRPTSPRRAKVEHPAADAIVRADTDRKAHPGDDLFRDLLVPQLELEVGMEARLRLEVSPRTYVHATVREGDTVYKDVAVRLKGGPGSFQRFHDTPSFTVNFDKFVDGQTFHGLKKIHLNSSVQDHTWLNEKISRELFEAAGLPVPRAGHAIVTLNGRAPRLYVVLEGVNKQFLKRYFKDANGNVYDGHSQTDVTDALPINSGEETRDRLQDLARAARESDLNTRLHKLEQTLDLDRFISFMALEIMLSHWDGYTMARNNYRIAHDRDTDRMVFIPHGMDQVLGGARQPLLSPAPAGLVARAVLQIPEARQRYRERVAQLTTNVFKADAITNRVTEIAQSIAEAFDDVDPSTAAAFRRQIGPAVCKKVQKRALQLLSDIDALSPLVPARFDQFSTLALTNWTSKTDLGEAQFGQEKDGKGPSALYIGTSSGCTASWRTSAVLDRGRYRLEARIKTRGVVLNPGDLRAGAGLRTSRHRTGQKNEGDRDWTPIFFDFSVDEDRTDKELVCELRANKGEIWYDLNSLRLKKLE